MMSKLATLLRGRRASTPGVETAASAPQQTSPQQPAPQTWAILRSNTQAPLEMIQQGQFAQAEQLLMHQLSVKPGNRETLTQLAILNEVQEHWEAALHWWDSIQLPPARRWETVGNRTRATARLGRTAEARQMFLDLLLKGDQENTGILTVCGNLIEEFNHETQKTLLPALEERLTLHEIQAGETVQTLQVRYRIAVVRQDWEQAYDQIRHALMIRPQDPQLQALVDYAARRTGKDPAAALNLTGRHAGDPAAASPRNTHPKPPVPTQEA